MPFTITPALKKELKTLGGKANRNNFSINYLFKNFSKNK